MFSSAAETMILVRHIFISSGHNFRGHHGGPPGEHPINEVREVECVAGRGIRGDRYFDRKPDSKGQITFFSMDVFEAMCLELKLAGAEPSATRRNVFVEDTELNSLVGREFEIQGVRFAGTEECSPCYWMNAAFGDARVENWLQGRGGLRARVLNDGILRRDT
jgi:MOSC domain-containing protein YiiM